MYFCPNLSNPDVAKEFNELVSTLGEVGAYAVWSLNNGYMVDKAPNGADSTLFSNLQSLYGDRSQAIKAKSVTYTQYFKDWFMSLTNHLQPLQTRQYRYQIQNLQYIRVTYLHQINRYLQLMMIRTTLLSTLQTNIT